MNNTMSSLTPILQWVAIYDVTHNSDPKILYQFDENGKQINIKELLKLSDDDKLNVLIGIPINQKLDGNEPVGNPFVAIDMKTGLMNINGTIWNFVPHGIDTSSVKFRPIWYHSVMKDYTIGNDTLIKDKERIALYKIGWQFTHEDKNYQRIIFYDVEKGIFSLKEKR